MRANVPDYDVRAVGSLHEALRLMADEPGVWRPIAGGTEIMVQFETGRLAFRRYLSIWGLPELHGIEVLDNSVAIGSGCTFSDLRRSALLQAEFPLLCEAASWTGSLANQNRGTLGGNLVNASPAADSSPALLVYGAELELVSVRGSRRIPYEQFHLGYKKTVIAADELLARVHLPRSSERYIAYARKAGARKAQAISKVCVAGLGRVVDGVVSDFRLAMGAVAPVPLRCVATEAVLVGRVLDGAVIQQARTALMGEIQPINDIRSTRAYRLQVAGNLLGEFLRLLLRSNPVLDRWNRLPVSEAEAEIRACCGSSAWCSRMAAGRPYAGAEELVSAADIHWRTLGEADWHEAFRMHPRIGERKAQIATPAQSQQWSSQEQAGLGDAAALEAELAAGNREYEARFGFVYIVCATGKTGDQMLALLRERLKNTADQELQAAAEEQRQITQLRLQKWMA